MSVEDSFVHIGPELFIEEVKAVDEVAGKPLLAYLGPCAISGGIVECGGTRGGA